MSQNVEVRSAALSYAVEVVGPATSDIKTVLQAADEVIAWLTKDEPRATPAK